MRSKGQLDSSVLAPNIGTNKSRASGTKASPAGLCRPEKRYSSQSVSRIYSRKNPGKTPLGASIREKPVATRVSRWTWPCRRACACCKGVREDSERSSAPHGVFGTPHVLCSTLNLRCCTMHDVWFTGCSRYLNLVFVLNMWRQPEPFQVLGEGVGGLWLTRVKKNKEKHGLLPLKNTHPAGECRVWGFTFITKYLTFMKST